MKKSEWKNGKKSDPSIWEYMGGTGPDSKTEEHNQDSSVLTLHHAPWRIKLALKL